MVTVLSHPPAEGLSPKRSNRSKAFRNTVWDTSSASLSSPSNRTAVPNTMSWYLRTNASNAVAPVITLSVSPDHLLNNPQARRKFQDLAKNSRILGRIVGVPVWSRDPARRQSQVIVAMLQSPPVNAMLLPLAWSEWQPLVLLSITEAAAAAAGSVRHIGIFVTSTSL